MFRLFNLIENNGNANFRDNGEEKLIDNLFKYLSAKPSNRVIFDIGANIGDYSKLLEHKAVSYGVDINLHLFEPTSSCFEALKKRFDSQKVILNNFGDSNVNSTSTIYYDQQKSGLASLYQRNLDSYDISLNQTEEIELRCLEEYIEEKNLQHIDFVKIDIEGHELKALEGFGRFLSGENIDFIQFEYGGANLDSHISLLELYTLLSSKGFVLTKVMPQGIEIRKYTPSMENFQYANYVAISKNVLNDFL